MMSQEVKTKDFEAVCNLDQYYQNIIYCMPQLIYILDRHCALIACNQTLLKLLGIERKEELQGSTIYEQMVSGAQWSSERVQQLKKQDIEGLLSGEPSYAVAEKPIVGLDGVHYFLSSRIPVFDTDNTIISLVVIFHDITEKKRLEEQIEKIKGQLQAYNSKPQTTIHVDVQPTLKTYPRVLLVEDNLIAQKAGQALLMQLDCRVDVADSGEEALKLFAPGKYDLVFMDIKFDDTSGYVVAKQMRQLENESKHHVPIIALTSFKADVVKYDCAYYHMEGALSKPLTSEQAKQIIQHYIHHIDLPVTGLHKTNQDDVMNES